MRSATVPASVLVVLLLTAGSALAWTIGDIADLADQGTSLVIEVGDGDRDGLNEVFVGTLSGVNVMEWTGTNWSRTLLPLGQVDGIVAGDGDRDGRVEVYAGSFDDGGLRRFAWTGTAWNRNLIMTFPPGPGGEGVSQIALGDIENDGKVELYVAAGQGDLYKVWFDQGVWSKRKIASLVSGTTEIRVGDGDRDGAAELYAGVAAGYIYEVEAGAGQTWTTTVVGSVTSGSFVHSLDVGNAKHQNQTEVYATDNDKQVFRFVLNSTTGTWSRQTIGWTDWSTSQLKAFDHDGDGRSELYCGTDGGRFYRFLWNGTAWAKTKLIENSGSIAGLDAGDGDNDGEVELYAANTNDKIHELEP